MPDVLVRDVDVSVLDKIKLRAKRQNRSLQSEMKIIFSEAAEKREPLLELELIRKIRASNTKVNKTDSVDLLREDRER
jgi:plasmid stability protein